MHRLSRSFLWQDRLPIAVLAVLGLLFQTWLPLHATMAFGPDRLLAAADICHAAGDDSPAPAPDRATHAGHCQLCQIGGAVLPVAMGSIATPIQLATALPDPITPWPWAWSARRPYASRAPPTLG